MVAIADGQAEIRAGADDALVVGDGTDFEWGESGPTWWSATEVRTSDQARTGANGYIPGRDLLGKHATTFVVHILGDTEADLGDLIDDWKATCAVASDDLVTVRFNIFGTTRVRYGRFRIPGEADTALARKGFYAQGSAQFEQLDPLTYGDDLNTESSGRTEPGSGFTPPFTPPFTLGSSVSGAFTVVNNGTARAPWTAVLEGPLTDPELANLDTGQRLKFSANGGVDLGAGDTLTLDSAARSVLLDGADRRDKLTLDSSWWDLAPGFAGNVFELTASAGAGTVTVSWRDAYNS